jgi:hypothetical protein
MRKSYLFETTPTNFFHIFCENRTFFSSHILKNITKKKRIWGSIKTHEILRKQHFFLHINFLFQKKYNESRFCLRKKRTHTETAVQFFLWGGGTIKTHEILRKTALFSTHEFFYSRKNKMKVGFGYEKKQFFKGQIRKLQSKIFFGG